MAHQDLKLSCAVMLLATFVSVTTQAAPTMPRDYAGIVLALARFSPGMAREQYIATTFTEFRQLDQNADGLDAADIQQAELVASARQRAFGLTGLFAHDLNADGRIERAEVERVLRSRSAVSRPLDEADLQRQLMNTMQADTNGDGTIVFDEARLPKQSASADYRMNRARELLALDPDRNGRLTVPELETLARAAFAVVDLDGNGMVSNGEYEKFNKATRIARAAQEVAQRTTCDMPKPDATHRFIVVGSYEGHAPSSVSIVGQDDVTTASRIDIEPGAEKLHLLLITSTPHVWQFQGATGRVARVALAAKEAAGIVGIPREKVSFLPIQGCMLLAGAADEAASAIVRAALQRSVGRTPDMIVGAYMMGTIALPSATVERPDVVLRPTPDVSGTAAEVWQDLARFKRAGVAQIDEKAVVAMTRAERYEVLPQEAGLGQLLNEGALVYVGDARRGDRTFRIVKPMKRFPAGLSGSHAVKFLVSKGLPIPSGNSGHSCVVLEATGVVVMGGPPIC